MSDSSRNTTSDLIERFDFELWLDDEGIDYRITSGARGEQINIKTCPRCGGSQNKVFMNRETGLGNCFHGSCVGEPGFNKVSFIKHYTDEEFPVVFDIIKEQAEQLGWRPKRIVKTINTYVPENIVLPDSKSLPVNHKNVSKNLKYLTQRGITSETTAHFGLKYCIHGWFPYFDGEGKERYQYYGKRLIIPVYDITGQLVTWQGRDITGEEEKKYIFPPGLPSTGKYLYHAHNVNTEHIIIGEGVFDVFAIYQALNEYKLGRYYSPVGSFGISLSSGEDQQVNEVKKLQKKGVKSVTFMWDGSKQAIKSAYLNGIELTKHTGLNVKVAKLPKDKDPNEVEASVIIETLAKAEKATKTNYIRYMASARR